MDLVNESDVDFTITTYDQAMTFLGWTNSNQYKFWIDLLKRTYDLAATELDKVSDDMSIDQAGARVFIFQGKKKAIKNVFGMIESLINDANRVIKEAEEAGTAK